MSSAHRSAESSKIRLSRLIKSVQRIAGGYLLHMGHDAHVVMVDAFLEACALVERAAKAGTGHAQRRAGDLHPRARERMEGAESFDRANGALASDARGFHARASFQHCHERDNAALKKVDLFDLLSGPVQQVTGEEKHLAQMWRDQREVVGRKRGEKSVANLQIGY